jgi:hypothetical protein
VRETQPSSGFIRAARERNATMISDVSVTEFLNSCASINVGNLERLWAEKNNVAPAQARKQFDRYCDGVVFTKQTAPSLRQTSSLTIKRKL